MFYVGMYIYFYSVFYNIKMKQKNNFKQKICNEKHGVDILFKTQLVNLLNYKSNTLMITQKKH